MDFRFFQTLFEHSAFDEIKVIGKDIIKEGHPGHIIGMTRKDKQVRIYILEQNESLEELGTDIESACGLQEVSWTKPDYENQAAFEAESNGEEGKMSCRNLRTERTPREQMRHSMNAERIRGHFLHIRSFQIGDRLLETAGANCGNLHNGNYSEVYLLFTQFLQAGWRVSETSPFYTTGWKNLTITNMELREEMEDLPEWAEEVWITYDTNPLEGAIELPVTLEVGKPKELIFSLQDGRETACYINGVYLMDVWAEEERKFADPVYRERMLQHVSEEQLEQMKEQLFEGIARICPKGMCFPVVEYECTENVGLRFLEKGYLDTPEKPSKGSATAVLMMCKPDAETGSHGLKMRACVIQTPVEPGVKSVEAELFSYKEAIEKRTVKLDVKV